MAYDSPGALGMLESAAAAGRVNRIGPVGAPETREQAYQGLVDAYAGRDVLGERRDVAMAWLDVLATHDVRPETRHTVMGAMATVSRLGQGKEAGPWYWLEDTPGSPHARMDTLAAVITMGHELGANERGEKPMQRVLQDRDAHSIELDGTRLLDLGLGPNPIAVLRAAVKTQVVEPMTARMAGPGWTGRDDPAVQADLEAHARQGMLMTTYPRTVPGQLAKVKGALDDMARGDDRAAEQVLFPHTRDRPLRERAVVSSVAAAMSVRGPAARTRRSAPALGD